MTPAKRTRRRTGEPKRKRAGSRSDMVVTTVALPRKLHTKLRILAIEEHTVLTQFVRDALKEWLERRRSGRSSRKGKKP